MPPMTTTAAPEQTRTASLRLKDKQIDLPIVVGSEGERAVDITNLRGETGYITLDPGYRNTGSCASDITFIDGEAGVLRYRGYPIEQVAEHCSFVEAAWLLIYGELPTADERDRFSGLLGEHQNIHEGVPRPLRRRAAARTPHGDPLRHDQHPLLLQPRGA